MKRRTFGRTGLQISELSMGAAFLTGADEQRFEEVKNTVHMAVDYGINYFDTAPMYGNSEEMLGRALEGVKTPYYISTKLGYHPKPFDPKNKALLRESFENSLKLLKREYVDILMIHEPDRPGVFDWWDDHESFTGPVTELMTELKEKGLIRFTGIGGTTVYELARIAASGFFDVVLTTFNYSLLWQEAKQGVIPTAKKLNLAVILGSPLQQGALTQRYDEVINHGAPWLNPPRRAQYKALYSYLDDIGISLPEAGLRYLLSDSNVSSVLTSACNPAQLQENVQAAVKGPLPAEVVRRFDEIAAMVPYRPCEEPFFMPFNRPYRGLGQAGR